jgi:hypothetical protein
LRFRVATNMPNATVDPVETESLLSAEEAELLITCSGPCTGSEDETRIRSLASGRQIAWDRVFGMAREHCVIPLLYRTLNRICAQAVPPEQLRALKDQCRAGAARNLMLAAELIKILHEFELRHIDAVPFKGPSLACMVYGDLALRSFADLDILIHQSDIISAIRLLREMGYQLEYNLNRSQEAAYIRFEHAFHFVHPTTAVIIELHWKLSHRNLSFGIDDVNLWQGVRAVSCLGRSVPALKPEDLFLYLCMHGAKHAWERLEWICCISEFINRVNGVDWDFVLAKARRLGGRRIVAMNLLLAAELYGNCRARSLLTLLPADKIALSLTSRVRAGLFRRKPDHHRREVQRHVFYLQTRERLLDRVRGIVFSCVRTPHPVSMDWQLFHVPTSLSFLYYLLRPVRIAREHGVGRLREVLRPDASV